MMRVGDYGAGDFAQGVFGSDDLVFIQLRLQQRDHCFEIGCGRGDDGRSGHKIGVSG